MPKGVYSNPMEMARKISESKKNGSFFSCLFCKKSFWRKPHDIKNGNNKYCSKECYLTGQRGKSKRNNKDQRGMMNPNWKGGVTTWYRKIRASKALLEWRKLVFKRDNWTCQKCGRRSDKSFHLQIEAHHIKPFAVFPELRFVVDNGLTLCKECHSKEPKGKDVWKVVNNDEQARELLKQQDMFKIEKSNGKVVETMELF